MFKILFYSYVISLHLFEIFNHLVLEVPIFGRRLAFLGAQDGLLELGELEAQLVPHLLGLALVESFRLPDVHDVLQAPIVLVIQRVDVAGAFGKPGLDLDRSFAQGLFINILLIGRVLSLVDDLIVVLLGRGVEDRVGRVHRLLVGAVE